MSELEVTLDKLRAHEGVEHVILLGRDGLVIQDRGETERNEETIAARIPAVAASCAALGTAAARGDFATAVLEFERGVATVVALPDDLLLVVLIRRGVGFAPLLRELRRERERLGSLL